MRSRNLLSTLALVAGGVGLVLPTTPAVARQVASAAHVNSCWSNDNGPVVLDSFALSPASVDVTAAKATVHITADAHDTGGPGPSSGIASMQVRTNLGAVALHRSAGHWRGDLTVPRGWPADGQSANVTATLYAEDRAGNRTPGLSSGYDLDGPDGYAVAVTDSSPDTTAPTLTDLRISPGSVHARHHARHVTVTVTADDAGSGVASVEVRANKPYQHVVHLTRSAGGDSFTGKLPVAPHSANGGWGVWVWLTDKVGNIALVVPRAARKAGFDPTIQVRSGPADHRAPRLVRVVHVTRSVDVRHRAARVVATVLLADNRGVASARLAGSPYWQGRPLHRISGTARWGVWRTVLHVSRCAPGPGTGSLKYLQITDRTGNRTDTALGKVHIRSRDRKPFVIHREPAEGVLAFRFDEPVHGISASHVLVYDADKSPVPGAWSCTGRGGGKVSCSRGAVIRARFSPDTSASLYAVAWEPDHQLAVLDRAGNPAENQVFYLDSGD